MPTVSHLIQTLGGAKNRNSTSPGGTIYQKLCDHKNTYWTLNTWKLLCCLYALSLSLLTSLCHPPWVKLCTDSCINYAEIITIYQGHIEYTALYVFSMCVCVCLTCDGVWCYPAGSENGSSRNIHVSIRCREGEISPALPWELGNTTYPHSGLLFTPSLILDPSSPHTLAPFLFSSGLPSLPHFLFFTSHGSASHSFFFSYNLPASLH